MNTKICFITNGYPTKEDPSYVFIRPVVEGLADLGMECSVIAPQSVTGSILNKKKRRPNVWIDMSKGGNQIVIYQPKCFTVSNVRLFGYHLSTILRDLAIQKCFKRKKIAADVLYGHFWDCGISAAKLAKKNAINNVVVASGESKIRVFQYYKRMDIDRHLPLIKGTICVSTKNLDESRNAGLLLYNPETIVLPNAIDNGQFYKMPKSEAREKLGMKQEDVIAVFVGAFNERKGVLRVVEAAERVEGLKLILIGKGEQKPVSEKILFSGRVPHGEIVTYLNAADMFVLPTLAEGCCNAIVEALACGLPVVSSNLPFNDDILTEDNSVRIDPNDIDAIKYLEEHFW
jgi:glycosyltransferase involved in cell wall biosynthesis